MKIIQVIPISRGIAMEHLSYFTSEQVSLGCVVEVPLRKRTVHAIVTEVRDVTDAKSEIKNASFEIRKIGKLKATQFFTKEFSESASDTARFFAGTTGGVFSTMVPARLFEHLHTLSPAAEIQTRDTGVHDKYIVQAGDEERFANYKSLIRESFARKASVFFCLPTVQDIKNTVAKLEKGIEPYTYVLHNLLTEKELIARITKLISDPHPVLIIATGTFLCVPRSDIGALVIEKENSRSYKSQVRPFVDIRVFAEYFSKRLKARLVYGDIFLSSETMHRYKEAEILELYPPKFRSLTTAKETIVDLRPYKTTPKKFPILSDEMIDMIKDARANSENIFIFTARKGLAPITVCGDCGSIVSCGNCGAASVLHESKNGNIFLCHKCGERRDALELCKNCGSWKLVTLGVGIERVRNEIEEKFPDCTLFVIDKDAVPTHKKALEITDKFYTQPGSILLGTEMALLYLDKQIENGAIVGIDSLFSIPDFRITEKICAILLKIRALARNRLYLQTRKPDEPVFTHALRGNLMDFYREEIALREQFHYPPFTVLIKISIEGNKDETVEAMSHVTKMFSEYEFDVFPSFVKGKRGKSLMHGLLRVPRREWPNDEVLEKLATLPPHVEVKVDPESLL